MEKRSKSLAEQSSLKKKITMGKKTIFLEALMSKKRYYPNKYNN
jgi:hypothetical protein